jgi:hypothetical protein
MTRAAAQQTLYIATAISAALVVVVAFIVWLI